MCLKARIGGFYELLSAIHIGGRFFLFGGTGKMPGTGRGI